MNDCLLFETDQGGYEWFGDAPGHEALSAYGLMQFHEMKEVLSEVDDSMIERVSKWIMDKRDGKGHFKMSTHGLDSFGSPPPDISDAYILWVLTSIGNGAGLEKEIKMVIEKAKASGDSYLNALVANILYNVGRVEDARKMARILNSHQNSTTGEVVQSDTSITRSSGLSLSIETTSLCTLAWMKDKSGEFAPSIELGVRYLVSSINDGKIWKHSRYYFVIESIDRILEEFKNLMVMELFELYIDNRAIQKCVFTNTTDASTIDFTGDLEKFLSSNQLLFVKNSGHKISLRLTNFKGDKSKFRISYSIQATIKDLSPISSKESDLELKLSSDNEDSDTKIGDITNIQRKHS